jgi:hypothetical protein
MGNEEFMVAEIRREMSVNEIRTEMDVISDRATARLDRSGDISLLQPAAFEFLTGEERERLYLLRLALPTHGDEVVAARARLKAKRDARKLQ